MGTRNGPYKVDFPAGTTVRIKSREYLEEFQRIWKLHHPLQDAQLEYAGQTASVLSVSSYHGGDELYYLENVPGFGTGHASKIRTETIPKPGQTHLNRYMPSGYVEVRWGYGKSPEVLC